MKSAKDTAMRYASSNFDILITGESGVGKELFAQAVHNQSPRRDGPFVAINCASLPDNLIESELFGYVKGAFTGADQNGQAGKFELADGGTLFLDEIGEMPLAMQSKLLRVLEMRQITRLGSAKQTRIDVRVIAASNRDLAKMIQEGKFRGGSLLSSSSFKPSYSTASRTKRRYSSSHQLLSKRNMSRLTGAAYETVCRSSSQASTLQLARQHSRAT